MGITNVKLFRKYFDIQILLPVILFIFGLLLTFYFTIIPEGQLQLATINQNTNLFIYSLSTPLIQRSLIAALIVGTICAIVGVFVVLRGIIFLGEAVTHSAFAGATFGILFFIQPIYTVILFAVIGAVMVGYVNEKKIMNDEI
ncbi:MAG: metal ABC transporter permease, partial [Candidatus Thorarchaeota archaeon]